MGNSREITILLAATAFFISGAATAQVGDTGRGPWPLGITVSGSAEVTVSPDVAYLTLGARTREKTAGQAATSNAAAMSKVMAALVGAGVPKGDVQTTQYSLQPVYEYPTNSSPQLTGYEATNLVRVTLRDMAKVGPVVDGASSAGANVVQDVTFSVRDESGLRSRALAQASQDAKDKAAVMAKATDVKLGKLLNLSEGGSPVVVPYLARAESMQAAATPISPQQVVVRASVTATYAIGQ